MKVNKRKSISMQNKTNYFIPDKDKTTVHFASPYSYMARKSKIEGYENRLYWEYRYCDEHNGQTFFYTLTYNDANIPQYDGQNCFDYNDLVYLLNGGFKKKLLRDYGTNFKYFVGAELGDGKGERGLHNNPHYHVLFFLRSAENDKFPYRKISPKDFRHLVRTYWQGFDESTDGRTDYRTAKFGIAKEGENIGLVTDFRACMYCAKYVTKDVALKQKEDDLIKKLSFRFTRELQDSPELAKTYFWTKINPLYNLPTKCHLDTNHNDWQYSPVELLEIVAPNAYSEYLRNKKVASNWQYYNCINTIVDDLGLKSDYDAFLKSEVDKRVKVCVSEYRNRYCNKCRISQGVGDYAIEHINDYMNPRIKIPKKAGYKNRPIGMYYYRKLFTKVEKDALGNNIRVLNDLGIQYKESRLKSDLTSLEDKTRANLCALTKKIYDDMLVSDVNTDISMDYNRFKEQLNNLSINEITKRYAQYKLVYEDRFLSLAFNSEDNSYSFPSIDVAGDYKRFLQPSYYTAAYNPTGVSDFLATDTEAYLPYYSHPYFLRYVSVFAVLDLLSDYLFVETDSKNQSDAEQIAEVKRFHDKQRLKEFYSNFN